MPILFRWVFTGCLHRAVGALGVLLAIYVIIETFDKARYLGHGLDWGLLGEYLLLKTPFMISEFMPVIVLLAVSIYLADLARHQEIVAVRAAGLGINKLLTPLLAVALLTACASFAIGEWITPSTNVRLDFIERVHIQHQQPPRHGVQWLKDEQRFFRITPLGANRYSLIMLETDAQGGWLRRVDAASASYEDSVWRLRNVDISTPTAAKTIRMKHLDAMEIAASVGPQTAELPAPRHMRFMELYRYIQELRHAGLSFSNYSYSLHRKIAAPAACLFMAILAAALCMQNNPRSGRASWGVVAAIALGLLYYVIGNAGSLLAGGERLPAAYAAWLPNIVFGGLGIALLLHREGY